MLDGEVIEIEPLKKIVSSFIPSWAENSQPTLVTFAIEPMGEVVKFTITHHDYEKANAGIDTRLAGGRRGPEDAARDRQTAEPADQYVSIKQRQNRGNREMAKYILGFHGSPAHFTGGPRRLDGEMGRLVQGHGRRGCRHGQSGGPEQDHRRRRPRGQYQRQCADRLFHRSKPKASTMRSPRRAAARSMPPAGSVEVAELMSM